MLQYASLISEFRNEAWDSKPTTQFSGLKKHDGHTAFTSVNKRTVHLYIKASTVLSAALSHCLWTWIIYTVHMGLTSPRNETTPSSETMRNQLPKKMEAHLRGCICVAMCGKLCLWVRVEASASYMELSFGSLRSPAESHAALGSEGSSNWWSHSLSQILFQSNYFNALSSWTSQIRIRIRLKRILSKALILLPFNPKNCLMHLTPQLTVPST